MMWLAPLVAAVLALVLYLLAWPVPVQPVAWQAQPVPGYAGVHAANERLGALQHIALGGEEGPEHVALGPDGKLYAAVDGGKILRMNPDGSAREVFAQTGGRVLGFDFDAAGNLIAADAFKGLLSVSPGRVVTLLTNHVQTDPIRFADAVVVARSGKIYFSDATTRFGPKDWGGVMEASVLDIIEGTSTGRVLEFDPATRATRIVAHGLAFANGVALSADQQSLFVNETARFRIWKIAVDANQMDLRKPAAQAQIVFDNLPGYPDNLMRAPDGKIWVGLVKPRNADADKLAPQPFMRKLVVRLPRALWPVPKPYAHVFAFTEDGKVVADLQDPRGAYPDATGVTETADRLYVQSLHAKTLGWLPK